jgi:multidrug efflux system outer membrane protein
MAARLYLTWREALARAAADEEAVASLAANERLVEVRTRAGLAPQLERLSLATERAAAEARPAAARQAAATARLGLEALLGYSPGTLRYLESRVSDIPLPRGADPLDSPAAVLARRPDLIAAEFELAGADARSVAARRDFWPTISIGAMLGLGAIDTSVSGPTGGPIARASAGLLAPLLSFGRLEAARDEQDALRREAALRYRQAVSNALAEVETALAITRETGSRLSSLTVAIASSRDRTRLAEARYRAGLASYLEVLAAVTAEARLESELVTARADRARAHVALSTAMGLGAS